MFRVICAICGHHACGCSPEEFGVASGAIENKVIILDRVDQNPVRLDVTIPLVRMSATEGMVTILLGQLSAFGKFSNDYEQLLEVLPLSQKSLHVAPELCCSPNCQAQDSKSFRNSSTE